MTAGMQRGQQAAAVTSRALTNKGRAAIGLPVVNDLVLVPVRPADRPTNEGV